ncbi:MAG: CRISPR system precrRNA processing endoribonuclease RAMP protein Cas6 [Thermodesulfobacteriota bacterium]
MVSYLEEFPFFLSVFETALEAVDPIHLPAYQGSTLRGAFGQAFRQIACAVRRTYCPDCLLREKCVYAYVFETPPPAEAAMMRLYPTVPHPYVLEPPSAGRREVAPGEPLTMRLVLVGRGLEYLPYYVYAVQQMGRLGLGRDRGRFILKKVAQVGWPSDGRTVLFEDGAGRLERPSPPVTWPEIAALSRSQAGVAEIGLELITPLRLKYDGRLVHDFEFHHLIRNLLRRLSALSYFHCGGDGRLDFRRLIKQATAVETTERHVGWLDWERYSSRQDSRMKLGGLVGRAVFRGELGEFLPYLRLGELVHAGKGTSFGLGKYRLNWSQTK